MDSQNQTTAEVRKEQLSPSAGTIAGTATVDTNEGGSSDAKTKFAEESGNTQRKSKHRKSKALASGGDSSSDTSDGVESLTDSSESESVEEIKKPKNKKKTKKATKEQDDLSKVKKIQTEKLPKPTKSKKAESTESDDSSDDSEVGLDFEDNNNDMLPSDQQDLAKQLQLLQFQQQLQGGNPYQFHNPGMTGNPYQFNKSGMTAGIPPPSIPPIYDQGLRVNAAGSTRARWGSPGGSSARRNLGFADFDADLLFGGLQQHKERKNRVGAAKLDFRRVDEIWDNAIHQTKLQDTAQGAADDPLNEFLFHVRRTFDWDGKYKTTLVDIKSKPLRESLQNVIGNVKGVSLVEETPKLDPNMLFLYLEDLRKHRKDLKKAKTTKGSKHEKRKEQKRIDTKRQHLKVLIRYIDEDYADVKKSLYPMLENGLITYDLLWALWKPNTLAYTTTYGSQDEPRVFKVDMAEKHVSLMKGAFYYVEGKYFEYDGRQFGFGTMAEEMEEFRGARKITSLKCYPLKYHKTEAQLRQELIERGKKFVSLSGVHYKSLQGMAYYKKKRSIVKVNINGRIMVDPSTFRRINPNYPISLVRPRDHDILDSEEDSDDEFGCGPGDSDSGGGERGLDVEKIEFVTKAFKDAKGRTHVIQIPKPDSDENNNAQEKLDQIPAKGQQTDGDATDKETKAPGDGEHDGDESKVPQFSDEEYLIASPVVLGFAFAEKLWLELTVSGVKEIQWNEDAYESLVLETKTKDIVKALVESHKYHAAESIDDVIVGKGKGLVAVLHGPPGTGKTLTAEGISELLKSPLYFVSAGELGTDPRYLENELQKILDICHAWGAILLLDEADVFLEKRNMHDIHRNALVSIFLRQLEYFQGILFLTTNRVEAWDEAFNSRVHIALKYENLNHRAKKAIFKIFLERVRVVSKLDTMPFSEEDLDLLARHELNGRQIKNTVRTAQALAVNKREPLAMSHITQVLEVQMKFQHDLAGGPGYQEAMRSYF